MGFRFSWALSVGRRSCIHGVGSKSILDWRGRSDKSNSHLLQKSSSFSCKSLSLSVTPSRYLRRSTEMAESKEPSSSTPLSPGDPEDPVKSPPSSPNSSTRKACYTVLQSWVSKKFMTGCVVLFPVAITFLITWWFIQFVDGFFSPIYARLGINIFGLGFITSLLFIFFIGIFASSWMGSTVFLLGEWFIKRMPFVRHLYSASKQISSAISPDQNTTAFKEVAIIRHPRVGEYAFGFITSSVILQTNNGNEELCSVYVPTNHLYIGDIFLVNSEEIIRPNLSIREGIDNCFCGYDDAASDFSIRKDVSTEGRYPHEQNIIDAHKVDMIKRLHLLQEYMIHREKRLLN